MINFDIRILWTCDYFNNKKEINIYHLHDAPFFLLFKPSLNIYFNYYTMHVDMNTAEP